MGEATLPAGSCEPALSLRPDDQAFRAPRIPFDGRRAFGAPGILRRAAQRPEASDQADCQSRMSVYGTDRRRWLSAADISAVWRSTVSSVSLPILLSLAWREGEAWPTNAPRAKPKRLSRRPDPFAAVTSTLREWFEGEPWHTSRELLERLQAEHPGVYPDGRLRTLQRRLKEWRREAAHRMVFGTTTADPARDIERGLLGNGTKSSPSDREGGAKSPVDLPLCLDDANASPTTRQGPQQQLICIK